jgi:hypothetical protein
MHNRMSVLCSLDVVAAAVLAPSYRDRKAKKSFLWPLCWCALFSFMVHHSSTEFEDVELCLVRARSKRPAL